MNVCEKLIYILLCNVLKVSNKEGKKFMLTSTPHSRRMVYTARGCVTIFLTVMIKGYYCL